MMKRKHPIFDNLDIWRWVYGIPLVIGVVAAVTGYPIVAILCIFGVLGSFGLICAIAAIQDR